MNKFAVLKDCWQYEYIIITDHENATLNLPSDKQATINALIIKSPNKAATCIVFSDPGWNGFVQLPRFILVTKIG